MLARSVQPSQPVTNAYSAHTARRVVIIDDFPEIAALLESELPSDQFEVSHATSAASGWDLIRKSHPQIVLLNLELPDTETPEVQGIDLLDRILDWDFSIQVLLVSSDHSTDRAVEAIRRGAFDYVARPVTPSVLRDRLGSAIAAVNARGHRTGAAQNESSFGEMVGGSAPMRDVYSRIRRIGPNFRTSLITGATGTGKELVARALHRYSPVSNRPFIVCNCAAIVETLFESELFGHARGAFTGAIQDRQGLFEAADGGTLFLDEIGEIPLHLQSKLLRVLQNSELQRVGSHAVRKIEIRVIAATNRDLREMSRKGQFREDLFYRLSMLEIKLPALAERKEDLSLLQQRFFDKFNDQFGKKVKGVTRRAQALLQRHYWPGNIRELENVIGHACVMASGDMVDVPDLPEYLHSREAAHEGQGLLTLGEVEKRHVHSILAQVDGNKLEAAEILGISRATIYRILAEKES